MSTLIDNYERIFTISYTLKKEQNFQKEQV